jgi:hypothetical protein
MEKIRNCKGLEAHPIPFSTLRLFFYYLLNPWHGSVNPVVALNSAFGFIKPLTIEAQPINQRNPLDHPNSDL